MQVAKQMTQEATKYRFDIMDMASAFNYVIDKMYSVNKIKQLVGNPTLYQWTSRDRVFAKNKSRRTMTIEQLCNNPVDCPAIVVLHQSDGSVDHAFSVIDNLIFDSRLEYAVRLCPEVIDNLCHPAKAVDIHAMLRFQPSRGWTGQNLKGRKKVNTKQCFPKIENKNK